MKSFNLIILVLATLFVCSEATAQSQNNRGFGRGKFLKRLRDDLMGKNRSNSAQQQRRVPTPVAKGKVPTPATRPAPNPQRPKPLATAPQNFNVRQPNALPPINRAPAKTALRRDPQSKDFGMTIAKSQSDGFVVTKMEPNGNAARAGVKQGDRIVEIGGSGLDTIGELDSIAEVMDQGDRMEFTVESRGGEPRKIMVQYGIEPDFDDENAKANVDESFPQAGVQGMRSVLVQPSKQSVKRTGEPTSSPRQRGSNSQARYRIDNEQRRQSNLLQQQLRRYQNPRHVPQSQNLPPIVGPTNSRR